MAAPTMAIDASALQAIQGVAGHDGMLSNAAGELVVKPCTQAEIDFYESTLASHPDFVEFMPVYMGTLTLGSPDGVIAATDQQPANDAVPKAQGKKIATSTAIVLENLEYGFTRPNVIDLKLGSRLYAPGTADEKAARLDKVASETTSGSLNFRIAGMKVWNMAAQSYDIYDKQYGRKFDKDTVGAGFSTFFESLSSERNIAAQFAALMREDVIELAEILEEDHGRFYSTSILIVYEGDTDVLIERMRNPIAARLLKSDKTVQPQKPKAGPDEHDGPDDYSDEDYEESEEDEDIVEPTWRLKMIDFAHSQWVPGAGPDENVIDGLHNIGSQLRAVVEGVVGP